MPKMDVLSAASVLFVQPLDTGFRQSLIKGAVCLSLLQLSLLFVEQLQQLPAGDPGMKGALIMGGVQRCCEGRERMIEREREREIINH